MYFVDNGSAVPVMPQVKPVSSATPQFFTEGGNGTPPTYPGPDWFNIFQLELLNVLKEAQINPDKANHTQLVTAMKKLFLDASSNGSDIPDKAAFLSNLGFLSGKTATGGWVRLQGGFLFQWGRIENASAGAGIDVFFPTPFTEPPAYTFGVTSSACDVYVCEGSSETRLSKVRCISYENKMSDKAGYFMAAGF